MRVNLLPENTILEGGERRPRLVGIDAARGVAIIAMLVYHTAWDLTDLDLYAIDLAGSTGWIVFARFFASVFIFLVGVGLVLAHRNGVRPRAFWRRLAVLAGAACVITVATYFAFPDSYIFFGVLHNMTVSSVLALPFVRAPVGFAVAGALILGVAPLFPWPAAFDSPWLYPLGLGRFLPETNDYEPIFPWSGLVLAGVAAARIAGPVLARYPLPSGGRVGTALAALGRRSLVIYLIHQPIIFGALSAVRAVTGPNPVAEAAPFTKQCVATCQGSGGTEPLCRTSCACTVDGLKREGLWSLVLSGHLDDEERVGASRIAGACLKPARE